MRPLHRIFLLFFLTLHCSTTKNYSFNRLNDLKDTVTIGVEKENFGISIFLWCFGGGIASNSSSVGFGLRDGHLGAYYSGGKKRIEFFQSWNVNSSWREMGNSRILVNSLEHYPETRNDRAKRKEFEILNILMLIPVSRREQENKSYGRCNAPLKVETQLAIYYGIRIGFNISEFADFFLGFSTFDILNDDTEP